ncbi:MAG: hypothetical protein JRN52_00355 [Nitrososphaerota archaeon]|nr:hypothetical protein [Nitrososphaerota archaeon]
MKFPDRPIVSAALGIVFALALLVVLSSPALLVSNLPAKATVPSGASQSSQTTPLYAVQSTQTPASTIESSTATRTEVSTVTMSTSANTLTTPSSSSVSSAAVNASTVTSVQSLTTVGASTVTFSSTQPSPTSTGVPPEVTYGSDHTTFGRASLFLVVASDTPTLLVLTSASAVVALGAMLFVRRRERTSDEEREPAIE